jgi:hypothetical protein
MGYLIDSGLKMTLGMAIELDVDDEVGEIVMAAEKGDLDGVQYHYKEYQRMERLRNIGYEMLIDGGLKEWDWQWAADKGMLCDMDWEWFKEDLEKAKVSREEFDKKWKS